MRVLAVPWSWQTGGPIPPASDTERPPSDYWATNYTSFMAPCKVAQRDQVGGGDNAVGLGLPSSLGYVATDAPCPAEHLRRGVGG